MKATTSGTARRHANIGRLLNNAVRRFEGRVLELMSEKGHDETRIAHVSLTRADLALIRPDQIVAWRGNASQARLIGRVLGRALGYSHPVGKDALLRDR